MRCLSLHHFYSENHKYIRHLERHATVLWIAYTYLNIYFQNISTLTILRSRLFIWPNLQTRYVIMIINIQGGKCTKSGKIQTPCHPQSDQYAKAYPQDKTSTRTNTCVCEVTLTYEEIENSLRIQHKFSPWKCLLYGCTNKESMYVIKIQPRYKL